MLGNLKFLLIIGMLVVRNVISRLAGGISATRISPLQRIYDSLTAAPLTNLDPSSSSQLIDCMSYMDQITLEDLGLSEAALSKVRDSVCMTITSCSAFDIAVFILPRYCTCYRDNLKPLQT